MAHTINYSIGKSNLDDITLTATIGDYLNIYSYNNVYGVQNNPNVPGCNYELVKASVYDLKGTVTTAGTYKIRIRSATEYFGTITLEVYGITLNYNGVYSGNTSLVKGVNVSVLNSTITLESAGSRTGMECTGWYSAQAGGTKKGMPGSSYVFSQTDADAAVNRTVSFYSQWATITHTIYFETRGGSTVSKMSVAYGQAATLPTSTRPG